MTAPEQARPLRVRALRSPSQPDTIVLIIGGPIKRADIPLLCGRVRRLLEKCQAEVLVCDAGGFADPDAVVVDALARLRLTVRRMGGELRLLRVGGELRDLLALTGLSEVVLAYDELALESRGQPEQRQQACGVEEEGETGDLPA